MFAYTGRGVFIRYFSYGTIKVLSLLIASHSVLLIPLLLIMSVGCQIVWKRSCCISGTFDGRGHQRSHKLLNYSSSNHIMLHKYSNHHQIPNIFWWHHHHFHFRNGIYKKSFDSLNEWKGGYHWWCDNHSSGNSELLLSAIRHSLEVMDSWIIGRLHSNGRQCGL